MAYGGAGARGGAAVSVTGRAAVLGILLAAWACPTRGEQGWVLVEGSSVLKDYGACGNCPAEYPRCVRLEGSGALVLREVAEAAGGEVNVEVSLDAGVGYVLTGRVRYAPPGSPETAGGTIASGCAGAATCLLTARLPAGTWELTPEFEMDVKRVPASVCGYSGPPLNQGCGLVDGVCGRAGSRLNVRVRYLTSDPAGSGGRPARAPAGPSGVDPEVAKVLKALGPEGPAESETEWRVAITRETANGERWAGTQARRGSVRRMDQVIPSRSAVRIDGRRVWQWIGGTVWTESEAGASLGVCPELKAAGAGNRAWVERLAAPHQVRVIFDQGGSGRLIWTADLAKKMVTGRAWEDREGRRLWEETRVEERRGGRRWLQRCVRRDLMDEGRSLSEQWTWETGPGSVSAEEMNRAP